MSVAVAPKTRTRVVFIAAHDSLGGAARAAFRVFSSIDRFHSDTIDIWLRVTHKTHSHPKILGGKSVRSVFESVTYFTQTRLRKLFPRAKFISSNKLLHSTARFKTGLAREINSLRPDVVVLGWLGNSTLSIEEIGNIKAPLIFRLSDMWVFSGAEHYTDTRRYASSYSRKSRPDDEKGPDLNRETFLRKRRSWKTNSHLVALSTWLQQEALTSAVCASWPMSVIPVPMDTDFWKPRKSVECRKRLGLPQDSSIVLFGAGAGMSYAHKGADLLLDALRGIGEVAPPSPTKPITLAVFGQEDGPKSAGGIPITYLGRLDDEALVDAYSACDVIVVPSRLEAFGQVAAEAQSCGAPVIAFDNSGLADVVEDQVTGRVVRAFDVKELADAISWILKDEERRVEMGVAARLRAQRLWHPEVVASQYAQLIHKVATTQ